ncbi:MAG: Arm DNA-binding domain-containing protein [Sutterella sp.]|nr:Arm DNA-binding domain-containing protein [Sutterella sp.]
MTKKAKVLTKEMVSAFCATAPIDKYGNPVKRKYYGDGFITGLFLEVFVNNEGKIFSHWGYRLQKRNKRIPLGPYPQITLDEARKRAIYCSLNPEDAIKGIVSKEAQAKVLPVVRRCAKVGHGRRLIPYHPYEGEIWQKDENAKIVVPRGNRNNPCIQKQLFTKFKG